MNKDFFPILPSLSSSLPQFHNILFMEGETQENVPAKYSLKAKTVQETAPSVLTTYRETSAELPMTPSVNQSNNIQDHRVSIGNTSTEKKKAYSIVVLGDQFHSSPDQVIQPADRALASNIVDEIQR